MSIKAQVNRSDYPEALSEFFKDAQVYDSSCSQEAQVHFIDKDGGYYVKKAMKGTLKIESLMTQYMHSLGLSAEVLYYGSFEDSDILLTGRIPGEDCTGSKYLSEPERLCDTTAMLLRTLHETEGSKTIYQNGKLGLFLELNFGYNSTVNIISVIGGQYAVA